MPRCDSDSNSRCAERAALTLTPCLRHDLCLAASWNIASASEASRTRSTLLTSDYFMQQCRAVYGAAIFPDTAAFNARFGGAAPFVGSHPVVATQGSDDPWQTAGVQANLSATYLEFTATCSGCSHCRDLSGTNSATDPPALTAVRQAALAVMRAWMGGGAAPAPAPASAGASPLSSGAIAGIAGGGVLTLAIGAAAFMYAGGRLRGGGGAGGDAHALLAGG